MRIHSDVLDAADVYAAGKCAADRSGAGVSVHRLSRFGSRSRAGAWDVTLTGDGSLSRRRTQADRDEYACTWEQWGWFLAHLFALDPAAHCSAYADAQDFHARTRYQFVED